MFYNWLLDHHQTQAAGFAKVAEAYRGDLALAEGTAEGNPEFEPYLSARHDMLSAALALADAHQRAADSITAILAAHAPKETR